MEPPQSYTIITPGADRSVGVQRWSPSCRKAMLTPVYEQDDRIYKDRQVDDEIDIKNLVFLQAAIKEINSVFISHAMDDWIRYGRSNDGFM
ncbi:hypothetical protein L2E82_50332 [Cichorium intybus]|nr:hypothetical protein L2E82_50332 [Cichorium intybus]